METPCKTVLYDKDLQMEAYWFRGLSQPFPVHFHRYYVAGLVEAGRRKLLCRGQEYQLEPGDLMLLNPGDSHACAGDGARLDYRSVNIPVETMAVLAQKWLDSSRLPVFPAPVVRSPEAAEGFRRFHQLLFRGDPEREEVLALWLQGIPALSEEAGKAGGRREVESACALMESRYAQRISLDRLCRCTGLSRSALLRAFVREKGITPYRYLETVRISAAKDLLDQGVPPLEAALQTHFFDQSHFTNTFTRLIGLPPGMYQALRAGRKEPADEP